MTTNGYFLSEKACELKEAGLDRVNVSFHSGKPDIFCKINGSDSYQRVKNGIAKAKICGLNPVKLNMVIMKRINASATSVSTVSGAAPPSVARRGQLDNSWFSRTPTARYPTTRGTRTHPARSPPAIPASSMTANIKPMSNDSGMGADSFGQTPVDHACLGDYTKPCMSIRRMAGMIAK